MVRRVPEGGLKRKEDGQWQREENRRGVGRAEPTRAEGLSGLKSKEARIFS